MNDQAKTHAERIEEISCLNHRIRELEQSESELKRTSEALRKSEERYRQLIENANDIVFRTDDTGRFVFVNPATLRVTGYEEKEIIGRHYPTFIRPDMRADAMAFFERQLVKGIHSNTYSEYPVIAKDGHEVWLGQNTQLLVENGRAIGFQAVARDITDRKRMEKELRDSEERYRRIIEASSDAILLRCKDAVIYANPAALKLFRANHPGDLIGIKYLDLVHPDDRAGSSERVKKTMNENWIAPPREHRIMALDGQAVHVESTGVPVQYLGETHVFGIFRDITERKRVEEELRRNKDIAERLAQEIAIIAEIGKVIGSTLDTEEVYDRFAAETQKLILFDSLTINLCNVHENIMCVAYVFGLDIAGRRPGDPLVREGSLSDAVMRTQTSLLVQPENIDEIVGRFPRMNIIFQAGLRSIMCIPLVYRDEAIGVLHFRSKKPNAYTEKDLRLAERIGEQIAGAIANAQLYASLKKTEQELKESEKRYRELSIVDDLTRLYNSRHFYFQLKIELDRSNRYGQPLTLLLLDLDDFKAFNDAHGHVEGDQVLWRLGQVVKRCLRETDFAFRYGGEEFTILLPMTTSADGAVTAERIRTEFKKETFSPEPGQDVHMTVSIGLAQYRSPEEMKAFVHRVDQLMYQGKKNGKDRVCCEP